MSGSHSEVQHTKTTVSWSWRTLVKVMMPCSAWLTTLVVVKLLKRSLVLGTGSFPMELEFPVWVITRISTGTEDRWWYVCTAEEVERKGSTAVRYLIQWMLPRPYTLECTQQALVSDMCNRFWSILQSTRYCETCTQTCPNDLRKVLAINYTSPIRTCILLLFVSSKYTHPMRTVCMWTLCGCPPSDALIGNAK